ncbi:MAG: hypothetical protein FWF42_00020 [Streptococcaceae bacterium]|nr:hypothetical protein [Streptococcaceae bacterium]MCL2680862.1 hypothetical protein [Streptococcaceae bacterium]MCL2858059.1 hypothetical protein [Streptococcaceae bacterium]
MANKTLLELSREIGIEKRALENKVYYLRRKGTELGTIQDGIRYFSDSEQDQLKSMFIEKQATYQSTYERMNSNDVIQELKDRNALLEKQIENYQIKAHEESAKFVELIEQANFNVATANANFNKALEKNEQLQLDYEELEHQKSKGFFARLFGE